MAQSYIKLADQIMFLVNQLMGFSFCFIFKLKNGPIGILVIRLSETKRMHNWMLLGVWR